MNDAYRTLRPSQAAQGLRDLMGRQPLNEILRMQLMTAGLIEHVERTKACPRCGTDRPDFSYDAVTKAGHLLLYAIDGEDAEVAIFPRVSTLIDAADPFFLETK